MTKRSIIKCIECPEQYGKLVPVTSCNVCDFNDIFKVSDDFINCTYFEDEDDV